MNQYIIYCDKCFKSCLVTGNKVNYFLSKCGRIFCDGCSSSVCSTCKCVCNKKQITNNMNPETKSYLTETLSSLKRAIEGQEYQSRRWNKIIKVVLPYAMKQTKKIKEEQELLKKTIEEEQMIAEKLKLQMKENEKLEKQLKELQQTYMNNSIHSSQNTLNSNMFSPNDSLDYNKVTGNLFFMNNSSSNISINSSHIGNLRTQQSHRTLLSTSSRNDRKSITSHGFRYTASSANFKPITPKLFKRRL